MKPAIIHVKYATERGCWKMVNLVVYAAAPGVPMINSAHLQADLAAKYKSIFSYPAFSVLSFLFSAVISIYYQIIVFVHQSVLLVRFLRKFVFAAIGLLEHRVPLDCLLPKIKSSS